MESFYDVPRNSPKPTCSDAFFANSSVPDVSIIANNQNSTNKEQIHPKTNVQSYNMWKKQYEIHMPSSSNENKENGHFGNPMASLSRKQVRFQATKETDDSLVMFGHKFIAEHKNHHTSNNILNKPPNRALDVRNKPFENIYLANLPNMHLDLSFVDNAKSSVNNNSPIENNVLKTTNTNNTEKKITYEPPQEVFNTPPLKKYFTKTSTNGNFTNLNTSKPSSPLLEASYNKTRQFNDYYSPPRENNPIKYTTNGYFVKKNDEILQTNKNYEHNLQMNTSELAPYKNNDSGDPTIRDLLKIIQQQNEQILILQKQVAGLLENRENDYKRIEYAENKYRQLEDNKKQGEIENSSNKQLKPIEDKFRQLNKENLVNNQVLNRENFNEQIYKENVMNNTNIQGNNTVETVDIVETIKTTPFNKTGELLCDKRPKNMLNKFAIDVMTSFEVSIRPQGFKNMQNEFRNEPKITEITESARNDLSMQFTEPIPIQEKCPSPVNSIHVDMQDYSSDEEEEECSDIGWTIYNNVMGQVNNILKKAGTKNDKQCSKMQYDTLKKVKAATLGHLKSIGVDITPESDQNSENSENYGSFDASEISFAVKQLLLKYLPSEHLTKMTVNKPKTQEIWTKKIAKNPKFSFATVEYMKKYNLLEGDDKEEPTKLQDNNKLPNNDNNKLLDITTLKKQPKLL